MTDHTITARVYYEDTDAGGIVYHATYLRWAERARTEWLRDLGVGQQSLREESGLGFVVSRLTIDYVAPARLDDDIAVTTQLDELGRASLKLRQDVRRESALLATLLVTVACIDSTGSVARLPEALYKQLQG
jgi:acyl-CoA thioester hydrolase